MGVCELDPLLKIDALPSNAILIEVFLFFMPAENERPITILRR